MAIVKMKKMTLIAHESEREKLLKLFLKQGCVDVCGTRLDDGDFDKDALRELELKMLRVSTALTFLREASAEIKKIAPDDVKKVSVKKINRLINLDEYETLARDDESVFSRINRLFSINDRLVDIKTEKAKLTIIAEQLEPYLDVDAKFSDIRDTRCARFFLGTVPSNRVEALKTLLPTDLELSVNVGLKSARVFIACKNDEYKEIAEILAAHEFSACPFKIDMTASEKNAEVLAELAKLEAERVKLYMTVNDASDMQEELKILYDAYVLETAKIKAMGSCERTQSVFIFEAWVPSERCTELARQANYLCEPIEIFFREPSYNENPPTQVRNNKFVSAFEGITEMFAAPTYTERDPNPFVAFFYFLFFGIMMGDAGYGIIICLACFLYLAIVKPVKNSGKMILMFGFCGIATVIWGALLGGWFAISLPQNSFLAKITLFNPLEEPLKMFMLALGLGALQLGTAYLLRALADIKQMNLKGMVTNLAWVVLMLSLFFIAPSLMYFLGAISYTNNTFGILSTVGLSLAVVGALMLIAGGAIGKKNPLKMVTGALGNVYGAVNVMSDLLSYSRIFGLGLATGVIGLVVNLLADIIVTTFFGGLWVGWIFAIPVLIVGHAFNMGINLIGVYVHDSRLQYIEFFGKFYEGAGRAFNPIGTKTKYTYLGSL